MIKLPGVALSLSGSRNVVLRNNPDIFDEGVQYSCEINVFITLPLS